MTVSATPADAPSPEQPSSRLRPELEALPARLARLPVDDRGYPVPWFVAWVDGKPEFRAMDADKWRRAIRERRCWVCGDVLGSKLAFVIGPMCGLNRTTTEPPCHRECAEWSARNCPFLSRPQMVRREDETLNAETHENSAGIPLLRNPGVALVWITRSFTLFGDGKGKTLVRVGDPLELVWYCEGRIATRAEVAASVDSGLPSLRELAEEQDQREGRGAVDVLMRMYRDYARLYPAG